MKKKKPNELIQKLIENRISRHEFDMLIEAIDSEDAVRIHDEYLKRYFDKIMEEHKPENENELKEQERQNKNK